MTYHDLFTNWDSFCAATTQPHTFANFMEWLIENEVGASAYKKFRGQK